MRQNGLKHTTIPWDHIAALVNTTVTCIKHHIVDISEKRYNGNLGFFDILRSKFHI